MKTELLYATIIKKVAKRSFMLEIIDINRDFVVVEKPVGMPSQSDPSGAVDAMTETARLLSERGEPSSLWLVHRLDRVVGGLLVFARNKRAAAVLSELFSLHGAEKCYLAVTEGDAPGGELCDLLYKDAAKGKSFVVERKRAGVKEARLTYEKIAAVQTDSGIRTLVDVRLMTGRFHQIRAQFSSRGLSLVGDGKYGSRDKGAHAPALFAYRLAFSLGGKKYEFSRLPDSNVYPWSLFLEILK